VFQKKIPHIPWYVPGATVFHEKKSPRSTMYRYVPCTRATVFHRKKPMYQKQQLFSFCQHLFFHVSRPQHCGEKKVNRRLHRMKKKAKIAGPICYYARNQPQEDKGPAQRYQSSQIGAVPRTGVLGGTGWAPGGLVWVFGCRSIILGDIYIYIYDIVIVIKLQFITLEHPAVPPTEPARTPNPSQTKSALAL
jgi:hypothetical protein